MGIIIIIMVVVVVVEEWSMPRTIIFFQHKDNKE